MKPTVKPLRIGTRGSPLALWQAEWVARALAKAGPGLRTELVKIRTLAEKFSEREAVEIGVGIFTRELDEALLGGEIDLAVHSLKDVPSELPQGLVLAAVPKRESPFDCWISGSALPFDRLPPGARIGTGSPRRKAQLLFARPDLDVVPLRGNVATRLRKMTEQGLAGTILAEAGLHRLGEDRRITEVFGTSRLVPAVGQGALGIMTQQSRPELLELLAGLEDAPTRSAVTAERAFLRRLRGGCQVPAGALGVVQAGGSVKLEGVVAAPDGSSLVRGEALGSAGEVETMGAMLADDLLERGGAKILARLRA